MLPRQISILCIWLAAGLSGPGLRGQQAPQVPPRGIVPTGSYAISELEAIDTVTGNLSYRIPLASFPSGRGGQTWGVTLMYNSALYNTDYQASVPRLAVSSEGGWKYGYSYQIHWDAATLCGNIISVGFPDGSRHTLHPSTGGDLGAGVYPINPDGSTLWTGTPPAGSGCNATTATPNQAHYYHTNDGTYVRVVFGAANGTGCLNLPWTVYFGDGRSAAGIGCESDASSITDANGNTVTIQNLDLGGGLPHTTLTDAAGRTIQIQYSLPSSGARQDTITQAGWNGQTLTWTATWANFADPQKVYTCQDPLGCSTKPNGAITTLQIPSPAGTALQYSFDYSWPTGWGELSRVTLPSMGRVSYSYALDGTGRGAETVDNPVAKKTVSWCAEPDPTSPTTTPCDPASAAQDVWAYQFTSTASTITDPHGAHTKTLFNDRLAGASWYRGLVYRNENPDQSVVQRVWAQNQPYKPGTNNNTSEPGNPYVRVEARSLPPVTGTTVPASVSRSEFVMDRNGNVTSRNDYGFAGYISTDPPAYSGGSPVVTTSMAYSLPANSTASFQTDDANGYWAAAVPTARPLLTCRAVSGTEENSAQAGFVYDGPYKGNLVAKRTWDSTVGTQPASPPGCSAIADPQNAPQNVIVTKRAYDAFGNVTDSWDGKQVQTHTVYDSVSVYPTMRTEAYGAALARSSILAFDFSTGLPNAITDYNGLTRSMTYL